MLNKIQNNIQCMKAEAKEIVTRQLSPAFRNKSVKHIDTIDQKALPSVFFKLKSKNQLMLQHRKKIRAKTHLITQYENLTTLTKKNSLNVSESSSLQKSFMGKEVLALMPGESELLSTRFYGLYKQKKAYKTIEPEVLPQIKRKRSKIFQDSSLKPTKNLRDRSMLSQVHKKKGSSLCMGDLSCRLEKFGQKEKKSIRLKDWLNQESGQKENPIKLKLEDVTVEPWSILSGEVEDFHC